MKYRILAIVFFAFIASSHAQLFSTGLKGGLQTQINKPDGISVGSGDSSFGLEVDQFRFGTQFGAWFRFGNRIFIQPELVFNSNRTDYQVKQNNIAGAVFSEKYNTLDVPVLLGFKLGPVRVQGGPVGHVFLSSKSDLVDISGYDEKFKDMTWGYQAGLNIGFGRLSADLRYEGNFSNTGDHIRFFGDQYNFSNNPNRLILGLHFAIVK
jgi:hypothetical protein